MCFQRRMVQNRSAQMELVSYFQDLNFLQLALNFCKSQSFSAQHVKHSDFWTRLLDV